MRASVHIADVGARTALGNLFRKAPKPGSLPGLRSADLSLSALLRTSAVPSVAVGRLALIAFWDDDAAIDRFLDGHPLAAALSGGWRVRLEPLRRWGEWPGLDDSVTTARHVDHEGPAAVLTLARTRVSQLPRFLRTSQKAEAEAVASPGMLWGTALARPPYFATCSLWESTRALSTYAYGRSRPAHHDAIEVDKAKPFHHLSAFIRFRPYDSQGGLGGKNALAEDWLASGTRSGAEGV